MACRTLPLYPIIMYKRAIIGWATAYRTAFKINLLFSLSDLHCIVFLSPTFLQTNAVRCLSLYGPRIYGGRDDVASRTTRYGLDGRRIEFRWGARFYVPSRPTPKPTQPLFQWIPVLSRWYRGRRVVLTRHISSPGLQVGLSYMSAFLLCLRRHVSGDLDLYICL